MSALIPVEIFQDVLIVWKNPIDHKMDGTLASIFTYFKDRFISNFAPFEGEIIHRNKNCYKVLNVTLYVDDNHYQKISNDIKFKVNVDPEIIYVDFIKFLKVTNQGDIIDPNKVKLPETLENWKEVIKLIEENK